MTITDLIAEEARRLAVRSQIDVEEAELVLRTYGVHVEAIEEEGNWD